MAKDFMHTAEVVEAVRSVLKGADGDTHTGGLPANWFEATLDGDEIYLSALQHGDLRDLPASHLTEGRLPCILVRGTGTQPGQTSSGSQVCYEPVRIVHARHFDQCRDDDGNVEENMTRARERYAKIVNDAVFNDPNRKLATINAAGTRTEVDLSSDDTAAHVTRVEFVGWDLGQDPGSGTPETADDRLRANRVWAIALDIRVNTLTTE